MEKKKYVMPSMEVYPFESKPQLLAGSYDYDGGLNYVPGIPGAGDDKKQLA